MTNQAEPCPTCGALPCAADPIDTLDASLPSIQAGLAREVAAETQGEITQADVDLVSHFWRYAYDDNVGLEGIDACARLIATHRRASVAALQQENAGLIHDIERAQGHASEYLNEMEQMRERVKVLEEALGKARDQFDFYAREHRSAQKTAKAETNQQFADMLSDALNAGREGE